jgi:hypothetical protein
MLWSDKNPIYNPPNKRKTNKKTKNKPIAFFHKTFLQQIDEDTILFIHSTLFDKNNLFTYKNKAKLSYPLGSPLILMAHQVL